MKTTRIYLDEYDPCLLQWDAICWIILFAISAGLDVLRNIL